MIEGVIRTPLRIIPTAGGDVMHAIRVDAPGFVGFGEAYFSICDRGAVKAWKRHRRMTLNIVVPVGRMRFVLFDDRPGSPTHGRIETVVLGRENYFRLTVPPMLWMGFQGLDDGLNLLLNVADMTHDPAEAERLAPDAISFDWSNMP